MFRSKIKMLACSWLLLDVSACFAQQQSTGGSVAGSDIFLMTAAGIIETVALAFFVVGLVKPQVVLKWSSVQTRGRVTWMSMVMFAFAVAIGGFANNSMTGSGASQQALASGAKTSQVESSVAKQPEQQKTVQPESQVVQAGPDENELLKQEMYSKLNKEAFDRLQHEKKISEGELLAYYKNAKRKFDDVMSRLNGFKNSIKDHEAKVAALNDKAMKAYSESMKRLSVDVKEKSDKTFFGRQYKADVVLRNAKDTSWFSDNYEIGAVDVYLFLSEPLFKFPVYAEKLTFKGVNTGEVEVKEITSDFSGLEIEVKRMALRKVYEKGAVMDSKMVDI